MTAIRLLALLPVLAAVSGCIDGRNDMTVDRQFGGQQPLSQLQAGIWVDPTGCDHWIIDDGAEGYLSQRLDDNGNPVCSGVAPPGTAIGIRPNPEEIPDLI